MNICFECNSAYREPGTCNCFAPGGKRALMIGGGTADSTTWTVHARTCIRCGGTFTGSHTCGYVNFNGGL